MPHLQVSCAIIIADNKILSVQRSLGKDLPLKWEFPGGKIKPTESKEDCLHRELFEELNIKVQLIGELSTVYYDYPEFSITLYPFIVHLNQNTIILKEHLQLKWLKLDELKDLDWAEADKLVLNEILKFYNN
jgi:8-oxo-dGTP diphosphatase